MATVASIGAVDERLLPVTVCTCMWRDDLEGRLLPDPECPSVRHTDDDVPAEAVEPAS